MMSMLRCATHTLHLGAAGLLAYYHIVICHTHVHTTDSLTNSSCITHTYTHTRTFDNSEMNAMFPLIPGMLVVRQVDKSATTTGVTPEL